MTDHIIKYAYPQRPSIVTGPVADGIHKLQSIGIDADRILDIYLDAQKYAHIVRNRETKKQETIVNPYRYLAAVHGMTSDHLKVSNRELESTYNAVLSTWKDIPPLSFYSQFDSHLFHETNESGLETGMIATRLFASINSSVNLLIIDPSPSFLSFLSSDESMQQRTLTLAFTDPRIATICAHHSWPINVRIISFSEVIWSHHPCICVFGSRMDYCSLTNVIQKIHDQNLPARVYLLVSTVFINRRNNAALRSLIHAYYAVTQIVMIDIDRKDDERLRRCMIVLEHQSPTGKGIPIERVTRQGKHLVSSPVVFIPYQSFVAGNQTLLAMYADAARVPSTARQRNKPNIVPFSHEIHVWYTIETLGKSSAEPRFRAIFRFYDFATKEQQRRNKNNRGNRLTGRICGTVVSDHNSVLDCLDDLILPSADPHNITSLASTIRDAVISHYGSGPVSLKTFWFVHLPELIAANSLYDDNLCRKVFLGLDWADNPVCQLIVGSSTDSEIRAALDYYAVNNDVSPTHCARILDQLHVIWGIYIRSHPGTTNPVAPLIDTVRESNNTKEEQRDALVARSWDLETMRRISSLIDDNIPDRKMALAVKFKMFCGLESGVLSALTIGDYIRIPSYSLNLLNITKVMPQTGSEPKAFTDSNQTQGFVHPWKNRQISVPDQLANALDSLIMEALAELSDYGITGDDALQNPLFSTTDDPRSPILTRRINECCAHIVDILQLQKIEISCPEDGITTDLSIYGKDIWVANYKYHAANTCHMDPGSISYLCGSKPDTVVSTNYRGFSHPLQLREIQLRTEQLVDLVERRDGPIDDTICQFSTKGRRRSIPYLQRNSATEMVIDVHLTDKAFPIELSINAPHGALVQVQHLKEG